MVNETESLKKLYFYQIELIDLKEEERGGFLKWTESDDYNGSQDPTFFWYGFLVL